MPRWKRQTKKQAHGFTLVELLVASAVFSVVSIVALTSFVEIGRIFYRTSIYTVNQQTSHNILTRVSGDISATTTVSTLPGDAGTTNNLQRYYYCVGNDRYTFILGHEVNLDQENRTNNFGLLRDKTASATGCNNPFDSNGNSNISNDAAELLGNNMRLNEFCLERIQTSTSNTNYGNLYRVTLDVASGDNRNLTTKAPPADAPNDQCVSPTFYTCQGGLQTTQYCADSNLQILAAAITTNVAQGPTNSQSQSNYTLTITKTGGSGSIYIDNQSCDSNVCSKNYPSTGATAFSTVQAVPASGHKFVSWSGSPVCGATQNPCTFQVTSSVNLVASFQ